MKALSAALLSGIMFHLSQGLSDIWALAWIAPAPLLWLAYGDTPRWQLLLASLAAFAAGQIYLVQCYWGQIPSWIIAPLALCLCAAFAIAVLFSGEAFRHDSPWAALIAFPAFWTALEFGIDLASPHGSYGALGYAEVAFPAGIQIAALFGVHAVTFLLCLSANAAALLLRRRWTAGCAGVAVCAAALVFGFLRLAVPAGARVWVAALSDADTHKIESREHTLASEEAAAETYAAYIEQLPAVGVVAIPEGAIDMGGGAQRAALAPLAAARRLTIPWSSRERLRPCRSRIAPSPFCPTAGWKPTPSATRCGLSRRRSRGANPGSWGMGMRPRSARTWISPVPSAAPPRTGCGS